MPEGKDNTGLSLEVLLPGYQLLAKLVQLTCDPKSESINLRDKNL